MPVPITCLLYTIFLLIRILKFNINILNIYFLYVHTHKMFDFFYFIKKILDNAIQMITSFYSHLTQSDTSLPV